MRIAQVATLATPVRQHLSGSIESLVWLLSRELTRLGHEVTVFAAGGSSVYGELVTPLDGTYGRKGSPDDWELCEWVNLCAAVAESDRFDVIHSHAYLWSLPLEPLSRAPMVHTTHILPWADAVSLWSARPDACVTAISRFQWSSHPYLKPTAVIPHGVDASEFVFRSEPVDYVCYLGRFTPAKGPLEAIDAAREMGIRIVLAGPPNDYFKAQIAPLIDGRTVEYAGMVAGSARTQLLGGAQALLYPLREPEPFGLVMIEAMMCGTPVAATRIGAVPEIVDEGVTGITAIAIKDFPKAVGICITLDRQQVRDTAMNRFTAERMARGYEQVYLDLPQRCIPADTSRRDSKTKVSSTL